MASATPARFELIAPPQAAAADEFAAALADGLAMTPKSLPCRFFYDKEGSVLFERICDLPGYYLTRTERAILLENAAGIAEALGDGVSLVELGGGSSAKTRVLIEAILARQRVLHFTSVDISREFLMEAADALLNDYDGLRMSLITSEYRTALQHLPKADCPRALLFMGSNIGNFLPAEARRLLSEFATLLSRWDSVLVGIDCKKDPAIIEAAYNDPEGITERFNKNLLARINRELGGNFDLELFEHRAPYLEQQGRVEMRLVSKRDQTVKVDALEAEFKFAEGEHIHTENCCKYEPEEFERGVRESGLSPARYWADADGWFRIYLLRPA